MISFLSLLVVWTGTFPLCFLQPENSFIEILFEVTSAFGTVGLSTGITPVLSSAGKIVIFPKSDYAINIRSRILGGRYCMEKQIKGYHEKINQQMKELQSVYRSLITHFGMPESEFWILYALMDTSRE